MSEIIDIRTLRIGNILSYKGELVHVTLLTSDIDDEYQEQIGFCKIGTSSNEKSDWNRALALDLLPVRLSPEWFEKLRFTQSKSDCTEERDLWSIQVANNTSLYYDKNKDPELDEWYLSHEWNNNHFQNDFWAKPKFVHQVQNLYFALSGEEMQVI